MSVTPNEEKPTPLVPDTYVPPKGVQRKVSRGETWISIATGLGISPWDLIDYNFPGIKRIYQADPQRATRQVNWYLREYVGCQTSTDRENWAFDSGLTKGRGGWRGGAIYVPQKTPPPPPPPPPRCSPTSSGKMGRRPTFYRLLTPAERQMVQKVFGLPFPYLDQVAIGDGLGFDGRPWTDMSPMTDPSLPEQSQYQINMGDAAREDLTSKQASGCFVTGIDGTLSDLLIHEMTHVWQYRYTKTRVGLWASSVFGHYAFTPGSSWNSYSVEQQASIVEQWFHNGALKTDALYPYVKLVLQSRGDALEYASDLNLNELNRDLASLRERHLD